MNERADTKAPTPEAIAEAKANPGGWVYEIDEGYDPNGAIPPEAIVNAWQVNEAGSIVGDFKPNPNYKKFKKSFRA